MTLPTSQSNERDNHMTPTADDVSRTVLHEGNRVLVDCLTKIQHCVGQLSEEQVWWRPHASMNSIGNLILHLTGNVRQWMISGIGGSPDVRNRPAEFTERRKISKAQLLADLGQVVRETRAVLERVTAADMLRERPIQEWTVTGWAAIFDCIPHFKGHTQEIICFTRLQLGDAYQFHWQPKAN